jgi:hypothetical protein
VLALDAVYRHDNDTRVSGRDILAAGSAPASPTIRFDLGSRETFALAPAFEYSWTRSLGVLLGARFIPAGRNTTASITPAVAINFVH